MSNNIFFEVDEVVDLMALMAILYSSDAFGDDVFLCNIYEACEDLHHALRVGQLVTKARSAGLMDIHYDVDVDELRLAFSLGVDPRVEMLRAANAARAGRVYTVAGTYRDD